MNKSDRLLQNIDVIESLSERFSSYYTQDISPNKIITFLYQFDDDEVPLILKLLSNIRFLDKNKLIYLLLQCFNEISISDSDNYLVVPLGESHDSSSIFTYDLYKSIFKDEYEALKAKCGLSQLGKTLERTKPSKIVFFDDNITSGTQLNQFFNELIKGSNEAEIIEKPLSQDQLKILCSCEIHLCFAIQLSEDCEQVIHKLSRIYNLNLTLHTGLKDFTNYTDYESPFINSIEESEILKTIISDISIDLYRDKKWNKHKVYDRLLGYGNLGRLTVFNHNVPKSLVPLLWKTGLVGGNMWFPIFPERAEYKRVKSIDFRSLHNSVNQLQHTASQLTPIISVNEMLLKERIDNLNYDALLNSGRSIIIDGGDIYAAILQMRSLTNAEKKLLVSEEIFKSEEFNVKIKNFKVDHKNSELDQLLLIEKRNRYDQYKYFLKKESLLTKSINSEFLDDSDLSGDYTLFIVYTKNESGEIKPYYSVRSFSDEFDVTNEVSGLLPMNGDLSSFDDRLQLSQIESSNRLVNEELNLENVFVMDRLAGRSTNQYKNIKFLIFRLSYSYNYTSSHTKMVALARRSTQEKLLQQYLNLGFEVKGIAYYDIGKVKDVPHWVILTDLNNFSKRSERFSNFTNLMKPMVI